MKRLYVAVMLLALASAGQVTVAAESQATDVMSKLFDAQLKLAKDGDIKAWYHVGEMYEKGLGVGQDLNEARSWYAKAADKGNTQARAKLENWSKVEAEFAKSSERASQRTRQIEEAKSAVEARAREETRLKAEQEAARVRAAQQAKLLAIETKARADQEAKRKAETDLEARRKVEAVTAAAAAAAAAASTKAVPAVVPATPAPSPASASGPARGAVVTAESVTPIQAIMSRDTKSAPVASADVKTDAAESDSGFKANPCSAPSARFMSTCR